MSLLKEGNRFKKIIRVPASLFPVGFLLAACAAPAASVSENLVDCNNGPKTNSITLTLKAGQKLNVAGLSIRASSKPGVLETTSKETSAKIKVIRFDPEEGIVVQPEDINVVFTSSAKPVLNGNATETQVIIRADCKSTLK